MNIIFQILIFILFLSSAVGAESRYQWLDESQLKEFKEICVYRVDVRDVTLEIIDDDGGPVSDEFEPGVLEELAQVVYGRFKFRLSGILPLVDCDVIDPAKKMLVVDLKLKAHFEAQSQRLLMKMIKGKQGEPNSVSIDIAVKDSSTGKEIFNFSDTQDFTLEKKLQLFKDQEDFDAFEEFVDGWAMQFSKIVGEKLLL